MKKQISLSFVKDELKDVKTNKKEFLEKMDKIIPWEEFEELVRPCYYKGERGNKPYELSLMIRVFILQNLYDLSDAATRSEIIDSRAFSMFCGVESSNQIPDGDTIGRFRNLLIENGIQERFFRYIVDVLTQRGLILKKGTIVDSTFIEAPSSTKNMDKTRDPDAHSAKKGNTWHFGYKAHRLFFFSGCFLLLLCGLAQEESPRRQNTPGNLIIIIQRRIRNVSLFFIDNIPLPSRYNETIA